MPFGAGWQLSSPRAMLAVITLALTCLAPAALPSPLLCSSAADAVQAMDALCPPGAPLLHLATASRSAALLQVGVGCGPCCCMIHS